MILKGDPFYGFTSIPAPTTQPVTALLERAYPHPSSLPRGDAGDSGQSRAIFMPMNVAVSTMAGK